MNGQVICDTGPLIALSLIDHIDILRHLFKVIVIPEVVHQEILEGGAMNIGLANYQKIKWIKLMPLSNPVDPLLRTFLNAGETAAIALTRELNANFVLIDERKARKIARTIYGLNVIGSARVLTQIKPPKNLKLKTLPPARVPAKTPA